MRVRFGGWFELNWNWMGKDAKSNPEKSWNHRSPSPHQQQHRALAPHASFILDPRSTNYNIYDHLLHAQSNKTIVREIGAREETRKKNIDSPLTHRARKHKKPIELCCTDAGSAARWTSRIEAMLSVQCGFWVCGSIKRLCGATGLFTQAVRHI